MDRRQWFFRICFGLDYRRMNFVRTIIIAALLTAADSVVSSLPAAEIPPEQRRSGYSFMGPDTRAMQDDDTANPGMLWALDGENLWKSRTGAAGRACADCHDDARASMKGVAARYPAFDKTLNRPVNLEQRIHQSLPHEESASDAASLRKPRAAGAHRLCRRAIAWTADHRRRRPAARTLHRKRTRVVHAAAGPAQSGLHQLP